MRYAQWRVILIFGLAAVALAYVNDTAARWVVGAVALALLLAHADTIQSWLSSIGGNTT